MISLEQSIQFRNSSEELGEAIRDLDKQLISLQNLSQVSMIQKKHGMTEVIVDLLKEDLSLEDINPTGIQTSLEGLFSKFKESLTSVLKKAASYLTNLLSMRNSMQKDLDAIVSDAKEKSEFTPFSFQFGEGTIHISSIGGLTAEVQKWNHEFSSLEKTIKEQEDIISHILHRYEDAEKSSPGKADVFLEGGIMEEVREHRDILYEAKQSASILYQKGRMLVSSYKQAQSEK